MISLDSLSDEDAYSLLFILMSKQKGKEPYSTLSELSYIMDKKSFLNFISYYGGTTIKVPTADEFHKAARVLVLYHSYINRNLDWNESLKIAGYEEGESLTARAELQRFKQTLETR